ncbi:MAG: DUF4421 family protein [Prevotella sp.]|nr:DUF4421 family protein [Prevotella sp.]MBR1389038.1 DUF4421 family protein [Prevotella sp.]
MKSEGFATAVGSWRRVFLMAVMLHACAVADFSLSTSRFSCLNAQSLLKRLDRMLTTRYNKVNYDTAYIMRPNTKWTITARMNVSGMAIESKGIDNGHHYQGRSEANNKATLSMGVSYQGVALGLALNPAQLIGKYHDYELNLNSYSNKFGFDVIYQDAKNFSGWYEQDGMGHLDLPDGLLEAQTLNLNAYYAFNGRRFSYPAAFSQSYIQRRSAGSLLLAASYMRQRTTLDREVWQQLKMTNIGLGAGYGYNYVPRQGWLLHISALPTFIVYSKTSMTVGDDRMSLRYHFPETIITARGAVVRNWGNKFLGLSMVYTYTNIGDKADLAVENAKWRIRAFFGLRI